MMLWAASMFLITTTMANGVSDLHYEETFQSHTKSLGLKLSQHLHILGFATSSLAQARGVKTGDILVGVNDENLEAEGPKGLSKLSALMQTLPWPRTFRFKRVGEGIDDDESDQSSTSTTTSTTTTTTTTIQRGVTLTHYTAIFPRNERVGLHIDRHLTIVGYSHGSHGEMYAAEKLNNVHIGDVLISVNHDKNIVQEMLKEERPGIAATRYMDSLYPPIVLGFARTIKETTRHEERMQHAAKAGHISTSTSTSSTSSSSTTDDLSTLGDHMDIALEGTHHNHDAGNYGHHSANTFRIMRAGYGPAPTCTRVKLHAVEPFDGCGEIINAKKLKGNYAIVMRGSCNFIDKTRAVQSAGAVGLVVINMDNKLIQMPGAQFGMDDMLDVKIPSVMIESSSFDLVEKEMRGGDDVMGHGEGGGRSDRWTARIVLHEGCAKTTTAVDKEKEEEETNGLGDGVETSYIVGPRGRALYQRSRNAQQRQEVVPITGGRILVDLGPEHSSPPMRLEYMSSNGLGISLFSEDNEIHSHLVWSETSTVCDVTALHAWSMTLDDTRQHIVVVPPPSPEDEEIKNCNVRSLALSLQRMGFVGVIFATNTVMLASIKATTTREDDTKEEWKIPVVSLTVGDVER